MRGHTTLYEEEIESRDEGRGDVVLPRPAPTQALDSRSGRMTAAVQVDRSHYFRHGYDSKLRFCCYWHQIDEVLRQGAASVLEIGVGNGFVSRYLRRCGIRVITLDIDPSLAPSLAGSILSLPFKERSFDLVVAFEVLEHLPYDCFSLALRELARVSRGRVIVSVPDVGRCYRLLVTVPKLGERRFMLPLPTLRPRPHLFDGQHYWEIGTQGYRLSRIRRDLQRVAIEVERTYRVFEWPYNRLFVLRSLGSPAPDRRRSSGLAAARDALR